MKHKKVGVVFGASAAIFISALFLVFTISEPIVTDVSEKLIEQRIPTLVPVGADPGDNSGFFYFYIYPHSGDPATTYASNLTEGTAYEYCNTANTTCTGDTPYSTTFDIAIKAGVTNEDGYYTANQTRAEGYNWLLLTCADLGIGADTNMTEYFIANSTSYAYYHYVDNNGGSGYTVIDGQSFNITSTKFYVQKIV